MGEARVRIFKGKRTIRLKKKKIRRVLCISLKKKKKIGGKKGSGFSTEYLSL